jgi:dihydroflavonol-4-reductase
MTTLVTGGTGFVGGAIVAALRARGEAVRVLARPTSGTAHVASLGAEVVTGDILDPASLTRAFQGCTRVYHAAAIYAFWVRDRSALMRTEVDGTRAVMDAALACGVERVVYTSTAMVIGERRGAVGTEATVHRGVFNTAYEEAKYRAERVVDDYASRGLPVVTVNPGGVYGPGGVTPTVTAVVSAVNGRLPAMLGGALSIVHVDDVAEGHLLAMQRGRAGDRYILSAEVMDAAEFVGRACDVAGASRPAVMPLAVARALAAVLEPVARLTGRPPSVARDTVAMLTQGLRVDGTRAARELGVRYRSYEESLPAALRWYWEQGLLTRKPACLDQDGGQVGE